MTKLFPPPRLLTNFLTSCYCVERNLITSSHQTNKQTKQKKITTILIEKISILLYSTDGHIVELVWCCVVWYGVVWCGVILLPLK